MKKLLLAALGAVALVALSLPASATTTTWNFTASSGPTNPSAAATLSFIASDVVNGIGGHDILSVSGTDTINGVTNTITGLQTQAGVPSATGLFTSPSGHAWNYNDVLFSSSTPFFDNNGPLWKDAAGNFVNLYSVVSSSITSYYLSFDTPNDAWNPGVLVALAFTGSAPTPGATPLPGALAMFGPVAGAGLLYLKRRKRKQGPSASPMLAAA